MIASILCAILGAPLTILLHELSHAIAVWSTGGRVLEFRPWPHRYAGRWYFGRVQRIGGEDRKVAIAPLAKANVLIWCYALLVAAWWPAVGLLAWELVDAANWLQGYARRSDNDGGRYRAAMLGRA